LHRGKTIGGIQPDQIKKNAGYKGKRAVADDGMWKKEIVRRGGSQIKTQLQGRVRHREIMIQAACNGLLFMVKDIPPQF